MARKSKEDSQKTRDSIMNAAEKVFLEKGLSVATMADIADVAKISRGAIYGHYRNKNEVCIAMCKRVLSSSRMFVAAIDEQEPALAQLYDMTRQFLNLYGESGSLRRVLEILHRKCEDNRENKEIIRCRNEWREEVHEKGAKLLTMAVEQGELPEDLDITLTMAYIRILVMGICDAVFWERMKEVRAKWSDAKKLLEAGLDALKISPSLRKRP